MEDFFEKIGKPASLDEEGNVVTQTEETTDAPQEVKDEVKDEKVEKKEEPKEVVDEKQTEKVDKKEEPEAPQFSFDTFKEYAKTAYEKEFESEDDLKAVFEKASQSDELSSQVDDLNQKIAELTNIASKGVSGRDWFVNDDEFIRQQFLKNNKDKFSESALSVLTSLSPDKVKKLDPVEAIKYQMLVDNPDLEKSEVEELISEEYGIEGDVSELSGAARAKLKVNANTAKKELSKLYDGIEIPESVNWEEQREQFKESWSEPLRQIVEGIDKIQLREDLSFDITPDMKEGMYDGFLSELMASQVKPSEETAGQIAGRIRGEILEQNLDKVIEVISKDIREKEKEALRKEVHNDTDVNNDTRPEKTDDGVLEGKAILNW